MRTIMSVTICAAAVFLLMPQFRHDVGTAVTRAGLTTTVASYTEDAGRMLAKAVNALIEDIMPANSDHPSTRP